MDSVSCSGPAAYVLLPGDCNDNLASVNPNASEICGNSQDENCNNIINEACSAGVAGVKFLIEGLYAGSGYMTAMLYNAGMNANSEAVDSVTIELRQNNSFLHDNVD
jgi:hypothetical protein